MVRAGGVIPRFSTAQIKAQTMAIGSWPREFSKSCPSSESAGSSISNPLFDELFLLGKLTLIGSDKHSVNKAGRVCAQYLLHGGTVC